MNFDEERRVEVTLSRRNLLALLHKLDVPSSNRQLESNYSYEDGIETPLHPNEKQVCELPRTTLVLRCEYDTEHYATRPDRPGRMHPATERFVQEHDGLEGAPPRLGDDPEPGTE
jgi:hypothetical protein